MSELARGNVDGRPIHVGDQVMVCAEVIRSIAGVGALLRIYSKTDEMRVWVAESHLRWAVDDGDYPPEPPDGTLLVIGMEPPYDTFRALHRNDTASPHDDDRRHQQHWYDAVDQAWIDWPTAVKRGAAGTNVRRMIGLDDWPHTVKRGAPGATEASPDLAALDEALHACWSTTTLRGWKSATLKMSARAREAAADAVERHHRQLGLDSEQITTLRLWDDQ